MRAYFIIEGSMGTILDSLAKYQTVDHPEFKIDGFASHRDPKGDFESTYSVLVSWWRVV